MNECHDLSDQNPGTALGGRIAPNLVIETMKVDALFLDPKNARLHPERNLEAIKASLRKFGQQKPIVVDQTGVVIAGNGTLAAARALGWERIAIVRTELTGDEARAFAIADNRTAELAEWDYEELRASLEGFSIDLREVVSFTEEEIRALSWDSDLEDAASKIEGTEPNLDGITSRLVVTAPQEQIVEVRDAVNKLIRERGAEWEKVVIA